MERSLTVLLPVEDAQAELAENVGRLLEVLPELTDCLEIVIIDDGSRDATIEVAGELASRYPQVRVIRNSISHGRTRAIQQGLRAARGDFVLLIDNPCSLPIDAVRLLWRAAKEHEIVLGRLPRETAHAPAGLRRCDGSVQGGYQMLSRRAAGRLWNSLGHQATLRAELVRAGAVWQEIELGPCPPRDRALGPNSRVNRPNYLRSVRDLIRNESGEA